MFRFQIQQDREILGLVDLKKVTNIAKGEGPGKQSDINTFHLTTGTRTFYLKAESEADLDGWITAIKNTQVFGVALSLLMIKDTSKLPLFLDRAIKFVDKHGKDEEIIK